MFSSENKKSINHINKQNKKCPKCKCCCKETGAGNFLRGASNLGRGLGSFPSLIVSAAVELAREVADSLTSSSSSSSSYKCEKCGHKWEE